MHWFAHQWEFATWSLRAARIPPDVDIVHASSVLAHAFAGRGIPCVVTEHQFIRHPEFMPWRGRLQSLYHDIVLAPMVTRSLRRADRIVSVSRHVADAIEADIRRPVRVIHNWVDTQVFRPREGFVRDGDGPLRVLFVGNPSRWKGADVIPVLSSMLGDEVEVHCVGGLRRAFPSDWVRHKNIRVLQSVPPERMLEIYASVDTVLVPTRYEAFGFVALEAMSCGLPVIGFDTTGTAEVCANGETALLVPRDDIDGLAKSIRALADPDLRATMGRAGRERALSCFTEDQGVSAYLSLYGEVLGGRA
ncbi:glycosyltransferase family 4 protein [Luteibacter yeojuensis]|uniref:Glycosyltransferase family 4 protein n=1 Tax=Luteibacter yeojuensis TaxID=345309 RepID=A0A7X5QWL6_9GAMM|nr:glycosyltransferase family 4 protein [Luteibacter yeojuensis]